MRVQPLSTANAGMTRLRNKGNASPETLYDLLNGYILLSGAIKPRPGTTADITLPTNTKGLCAHKGKLYVFSHIPQVTSNPGKYVVATLRHPTNPATAIHQIHFAAAFMGYLYVVCEFADGNIWHYWLEELDTWSSGTAFKIGDRVFPSVENGYAYQATRLGSANPAWQASIPRAVNDVIEPTVYNGFKYTCVAVTGSSPASGTFEPDWPTENGAQVIEYADGSTDAAPTTSVSDPDPNIGSVPERYINPAGGFTKPSDSGSHF